MSEERTAMSFVFLSHRSHDKPRLRSFVLSLLERRVPVWVDNHEEFNLDLAPGEHRIEESDLAGGIEKLGDWPTQIDHALVRATAIVVFWSRGWEAERAILVREHNAAHIYSNVGKTAYIPVFLDAQTELPESLLRYRAEVHDTVQGYDVARYGDEHWSALTEKLVKLTCADGPPPADDRRPEPISGPVDWEAEIRSSARDAEHIVALLTTLPPGPGVDPFLVRFKLRRAVASSLSPDASTDVVMEAGGLALRTFASELRSNPDNLIVMPSATPSVHHVGLQEYWSCVFDHACILGPRMLGALLLAIRPHAWRGMESEIAAVMKSLEDSP